MHLLSQRLLPPRSRQDAPPRTVILGVFAVALVILLSQRPKGVPAPLEALLSDKTAGGDDDTHAEAAFFHSYAPPAELLKRIRRFPPRACGAHAHRRVLARSVLGRPVYVLSVGAGIDEKLDEAEDEEWSYGAGHILAKSLEPGKSQTGMKYPSVVLTAGLHPNERAVPFAALAAAEHFCRHPPTGVQLHVVALANPDGLIASPVSRKNGAGAADCACTGRTHCGVDLNRNFPDGHRLGNGSGLTGCDIVYAGETPLSEPEARGLARLLQDTRPRPRAHMDLHAYGQLLLVGKAGPAGAGYNQTDEEAAAQQRLAQDVQRAMQGVNGTQLEIVGARAYVLAKTGRVAGGTVTDFSTSLGVPNVAIELPPRLDVAGDATGYKIAESELRGRIDEVIAAVDAMLAFAATKRT